MKVGDLVRDLRHGEYLAVIVDFDGDGDLFLFFLNGANNGDCCLDYKSRWEKIA
jgi:hypothetical protein